MSADIARTIVQQLGGVGKLSAMTGAHNFNAHPDGVTFQFKARAKDGSNFIRIRLDPSDTYTVEFGSYRNRNFKITETVSDVYCDMLREVIERQTGLYLSL